MHPHISEEPCPLQPHLHPPPNTRPFDFWEICKASNKPFRHHCCAIRNNLCLKPCSTHIKLCSTYNMCLNTAGPPIHAHTHVHPHAKVRFLCDFHKQPHPALPRGCLGRVCMILDVQSQNANPNLEIRLPNALSLSDLVIWGYGQQATRNLIHESPKNKKEVWALG